MSLLVSLIMSDQIISICTLIFAKKDNFIITINFDKNKISHFWET